MNTQLDKPVTMFSLLVTIPSRQVNENQAVIKPKIIKRFINKFNPLSDDNSLSMLALDLKEPYEKG